MQSEVASRKKVYISIFQNGITCLSKRQKMFKKIWTLQYLRKLSKILHVASRGSPRVDRDIFQRRRHNSTVKIVNCDIFRHYSTVEKCGIVSKNVELRRIIPHIVEYCRIMSNIVEYGGIMLNIVEYC